MANRIGNSIKNVKSGALVQIVNKIMQFVVRTVFIKMLNSEYLGINGLFTNILTILSFAELGVGTAIVYSMYKPIAEDDKKKINSLMKLYKKSYNYIGIAIFILGLFVLPFLDKIVGNVNNVKESLSIIYILFLINSASSYFFSYKKSIIIAHQKQRIIDLFDSIFYIVKSIVEVIALIVFKNFIVYIVIGIIATFTENICISKKADKLYPYLLNKETDNLSKSEKNKIFSNVKSLVIYKFGGIIMNGTDNMLISYLINVNTVGLCSNYTIIINAIKSILSNALNGITASIGNLNATDDKKKKEEVFYLLNFIYYLCFSFCGVVFVVFLNPFINLWLGDEYVLANLISFSLSLSFFVEGIRSTSCTYRITLGLFNKGKLTPYIGAIVNILLSIILGKQMGVAGIFFATSIAQIVSYCWIDPYLIYKYEFNKNVFIFYKKLIFYFLIFIINAFATLKVCSFIDLDGILGLISKGVVVCLISNLINFICLFKTKELRISVEYIKGHFIVGRKK